MLSDRELQEILAHEKLSRKEKQRRIRLRLEARRFPETQKVREQLEVCQREIMQALDVRVDVPLDLEGDAVTVKCVVRSTADFAQFGGKLALLAEHPAAEEIFRLLAGEED